MEVSLTGTDDKISSVLSEIKLGNISRLVDYKKEGRVGGKEKRRKEEGKNGTRERGRERGRKGR